MLGMSVSRNVRFGMYTLTCLRSSRLFLAYGLCSMRLPIGGLSHCASVRVCDVGVRRACAVFLIAYMIFPSIYMGKNPSALRTSQIRPMKKSEFIMGKSLSRVLTKEEPERRELATALE